ncbi:MAG TPA: peptide chain release factor N(5)-glutamine methyltransferase [Ferruginibacter sp.]|nr:peptide chain release factor N(5)-glutamine methyltransferase [Ferruginibacter sp.]
MNIKTLYRNFLVDLQKIYELGEATFITDWVFEKKASLKRTEILKNPGKIISADAEKLIKDSLLELLHHKPVQYVLGEAWFYNLKLKVNEHVLIPRPETEELVEQLIKDRKSKLTDPVILDIGTGSGCIPIIIKKKLPASLVTSIDISETALSLAKENAATYHTDITFKQLDFLDENNWLNLPVCHIIISNPPYIPLSQKETMNKNVTDFEPHLALFVPDTSPLLFYHKIAAFGKDKMHHDGKIYLETHEGLANDVADIFRRNNYYSVIVKKDMYGKERMVIATA